jgi:hypothetical protein
VLNGANAALVETPDGWELIQYRLAELVDVETYKLTGLLRGQQGSESAMWTGAVAGSRILFMTGAERRLNVAEWERGLDLEWRAWRNAPDGEGVWSTSQAHFARGARMWSPAHLKAEWTGVDLALSWTRRARKGGDAWGAGEPPHEVAEAYRLRVSDAGSILRQWDVAGTSSLYLGADRTIDFPAGGTALIEAAQLGADGEPGGWTWATKEIPAP